MQKQTIQGDDIFVIHHFLSDEECRHFVARSENEGYGDAPINLGEAGQIILKDVRNNDRVMIDDEPQARLLWDRLQPFIPTQPPPNDAEVWEPAGLNERLRFYRYAPGQQFDWHFDGSFRRDNGERSLITFMVYLSDHFTGGETQFNLLQSGSLRLDDPIITVKPVAGTALLFRHKILHTGAVVVEGMKYVLRSDVMFRRVTHTPG